MQSCFHENHLTPLSFVHQNLSNLLAEQLMNDKFIPLHKSLEFVIVTLSPAFLYIIDRNE